MQWVWGPGAHKVSIACLVLLLVVSIASAPPNEPTRCYNDFCCPPQYSMVLDECFFVSYYSLNWHQARLHCKGISGDLAVPKRIYALQTYINEIAGSAEVFVGGNNFEEREWKWLDGTPVNLTDWYECQPKRHQETDRCLGVTPNHHPPLLDRDCKSAFRFACQYRQN